MSTCKQTKKSPPSAVPKLLYFTDDSKRKQEGKIYMGLPIFSFAKNEKLPCYHYNLFLKVFLKIKKNFKLKDSPCEAGGCWQ